MGLTLSLLVLAALALVAGAVFLFRRGERMRPGLMLLLALIMAINVAIWTVPDATGNAPTDRVLVR
ncbi:hypothetical protein [Novosphingobium lentum]|uniref:hypothetical protein n=1 Tax=Novosphingobium lentum TaxID=145287 RepID=UPI00083781AA|nr:hypothetical protein [Novosphingobium lentum]